MWSAAPVQVPAQQLGSGRPPRSPGHRRTLAAAAAGWFLGAGSVGGPCGQGGDLRNRSAEGEVEASPTQMAAAAHSPSPRESWSSRASVLPHRASRPAAPRRPVSCCTPAAGWPFQGCPPRDGLPRSRSSSRCAVGNRSPRHGQSQGLEDKAPHVQVGGPGAGRTVTGR